MPDDLRSFVEIGTRLFDDPRFLHKKSSYFQRNKRGTFHASEGCAKVRRTTINRRTATNTPMSIVEMAAAPHCTDCCSFDAILSNYKGPLQVMRWLETVLTECDNLLAEPVDVATTGEVISRLEGARNRCADDTKFIGLSRAQKNFRKRIAAQASAVAQRVSSLKPLFVPWAAAELCEQRVHYDATAVALFGVGEVKSVGGVARGSKIGNIHAAWLDARLQSREAADKAALLAAQTSELQNITQLCFDLAPSTEIIRCNKVVIKAWRQELLRRLTDIIMPEWEKAFNDLTQRLEPQLVGLRGDSRSHKACAILAGFPHSAPRHGTDQVVTLVPEVVASWLNTFEGNYETNSVVILPAIAPDLLDTVAALWDTTDEESPYYIFADAVKAARTL